MSHPASRTTVSEGDHTFRLSKADSMWVGTVVVSVVAAFAVEAVLARGTFPNGMFGLKLSTKAATVGEGEGPAGTAGRCFFIVVLRHRVPPEAVVAGVFYGRS